MTNNFMRRQDPDFLGFQNAILKMNALAGNDYHNKDLIPTYHKLLLEEMTEMDEGFNTQDANEFIDGLVDFGVIGIYLFTLLNGKPPYPLNAYGAIDPYTRLDILSTTDFKGLIANIVANAKRGTEESMATALAEWESLCKAVDIDVTGAFHEVMNSNMSKFPVKGTVDIESEIKYIESAGRYSDIICEEKDFEGTTYLVFKARYDNHNKVDFGDTPKFVKPSTFIEPNISKFI